MESGKHFQEFLEDNSIKPPPKPVSIFNKPGPGQHKLLESKVKRDMANNPVDISLAKKLFQYWVHMLQTHLNPEQLKMLELFNVPLQPDNEVDYLKYITALNIVSSSSVYLRVVKVVGSIVNGGLMYILGRSCTVIGTFAFEGTDNENKWSESVQKGLGKLAVTLADPAALEQLNNDVITSRIQEYYEKSKTKNEIKLLPVSPFYSMLSKVLENSVSFVQDVISDSGVLSTPYKDSNLTQQSHFNLESSLSKPVTGVSLKNFDPPFEESLPKRIKLSA